MFQMYKSNVLIMFCFFFHFLRSRVHITTERQLTSSRLSTVTTPTSCWLITGRKENTGRKLYSVEESSAIYISKKFQKVDKDSTCTTTLVLIVLYQTVENQILFFSPKLGINIPMVCVVLEGGMNTIRAVLEYVTDKPPVPVIVCAGSGRAADLISFAYQNATKDG